MKKIEKVFCIFAVLLLIAIPAFSQTIPGLGSLQSKANEFTDSLANSLPFNSTMGLNWSDAYIGQILALPPHFGIGFTTGFTTMNIGSINGLLNMFGVHEFDDINAGGLPLPGYTVEARIGGFVLPFDIGVKFGYLKLNPDFINGLLKTDIPDFSMDYMIVGGDIRYALIEGKKQPFRLSVGAGFNYLKGGISMPVPGISTLEFGLPGTTGDILVVPTPKIALDWETKTLDFKAQASVKLLIFTPYLGVGASHAWSRAGYDVTSDIHLRNGSTEKPLDTPAKNAINSLGIEGVSSSGFYHYDEMKGWSFRTFGGFSINIPFVRFDLTGMYDFISHNYGFTFGTRFQL